jgi:O-antigen/teichoic acid export membrane protein
MPKFSLRMRLAVNVLWNLLGTGFPLLVGLVAVPPLIETLGTARFGVLSLAWVVVGYFSFFDLGLGRAMTQLIAQKVGNGEEAEIPSAVRSGMVCMTILGIVGGLIVAALSPWLVENKLSIPAYMRAETVSAFFLLAASIPIVIITTGLRGILEGRHRFDIVNIVRAPLGALTYLGPLAVLPYSSALPPVVATLVGGRIVSCVAYAVICLRLYPELAHRSSHHVSHIRQLLSFGGWMTLSNIAGPLLLYLGRLALAMLVSADAVAYFSTPYDVVISLLLIPGIFVSVLFPMFTEKFQRDHEPVRMLYRQWLRNTFMVMFPLGLLTFLIAKPALALWINEPFSEKSYIVAQLLAIGVFINSFGYISQTLVQAYGRPDLTAKLHVAELIAYIPYMWWLVENHGISGAAIAWVIRVTISTIALAVIAHSCLKQAISKANKENT